MRFSVFTPIHKLEGVNFDYFHRCFVSMKAQTLGDWEWIILLNGAAANKEDLSRINRLIDQDSRIKVYMTTVTNNIGALKGECCSYCTGDVYVELDFDDRLAAHCLQKLNEIFSDEKVMFAYSNSIEYNPDGSSRVFGAQYGWRTRVHPNKDLELIAFPEKPHYMRYIYWAPNHVRAFRATGYKQVGGYNPKTEVGDDHELVCRFYVEFGSAGFKHVDEVLYYYYIHENNTCGANGRNHDIQVQTDKNYVNYSEKMYLKWAKDSNLLCLDLGGRFNCPPGYTSVDLYDADIIMDLESPWDNIPDNTVGVLRAYHILEHLKDPIHFFNEASRVLVDGGFLLIEVPSSNGMGAFSDPTHVKFFNMLSFEYYTNEKYARFIRPMYTGRFQKSRLVEYKWSNPEIPIISAHLINLKGGEYDQRWCGEKLI